MAEYNSIKLGGIFRTKRQGMYVGNVKPDAMEELASLMNSKKAQRNGLVLLLFKNEREGGPLFNLLADAAKPREEFAAKRRPIEPDDDDENNEPVEDDVTEDDVVEKKPSKKPHAAVKKPAKKYDPDEF